MPQETRTNLRPFDTDKLFVPVLCTKCGAGFLVFNTHPVNTRVAYPYAPDLPIIEALAKPKYGRFGNPLTNDTDINEMLEAMAARSFACAQVHHDVELAMVESLTPEELAKLLAKRVPYDKADHSVTLWSEDGELIKVTGRVAVDFYKGQARLLPTKAVLETIWYIPSW